MPIPYSLLFPPLRGRHRLAQWPSSAAPFDPPIPNQPPVPVYTFRKGGFYKPALPIIYPAPFDPPIPNQPLVQQYIFRPGGFYQPQKQLLFPAPFDPPIPNQPLQRPYTFRVGGFWQIQKFSVWPQPADAVIVISPTPPPPPQPPARQGGELGHVISDTWLRPQWRPPWTWLLPEKDYEPALLALLSAGEITEEEFIALLAAMRSN